MGDTFIINTDAFQITQIEFFVRIFVAIGIGFLIGLEREHASFTKNIKIVAGLRTMILVVVFGFISTFLGYYISIWILIGGIVATTMIVGISYWINANHGEIGSTTEFTTMLAFLLGCSTFIGFIEASLAITVVILLLLSLKVQLKALIGKITQNELFAFIKFVVLALLIFPFLPDTFYGPYHVINPKEIGFVILITSGLGFLGYLLMKFLGSQKGILLTGIVGGLVSSTAVTWIFSKKSKELPTLSKTCAVAILSASTIMIIRVATWVVFFNSSLIDGLLLPLILVFISGLGIAVFYLYKKDSNTEIKADFPIGEPLNIKQAVLFGIIYIGILMLVSFGNDRFGSEGILATSAFAALTDIDAITISISKLAGISVPMNTAQNAILLATLCNTIVKISISLWAGSKDLRKYLSVGYGIMCIVGIIGFFIMNY